MKLSSVVYRKNVLWTSIIVMLLVSVTMINVASASPDTYFWVDPAYTAGTPTGTLVVDVSVANAPPTYAWEIYLSWDPDRLELVLVAGGSFPVPLRGARALDEANSMGETMALGYLIGEVPIGDWPSGSGSLCTLYFVVTAAGAAHLDLHDTRLWDHIGSDGYPAPTYYGNEDGLADATSFFSAGLAGWKLKVNGKAGTSTGGGLKTTVGTPNLLEAKVENIGTFSVSIQVFFVIRDSFLLPIGPPIGADQGTVTLAPGQSTTLSTTWAAGTADDYWISAYALYTVNVWQIAGGFSKMVKLRAS